MKIFRLKFLSILLFITTAINLYAIDFGDTIILDSPVTYYGLDGKPKVVCYALNKTGYVIVDSKRKIYEFSLATRPLMRFRHVINKMCKKKYKNIDMLYPAIGIYIVCLYNDKNDTPVFINLQNQQKAWIKSFKKMGEADSIKVDTNVIIKKLQSLSKEKEVYIENATSLPFFKNTHITAMGDLLDYWGYRKKNEPVNTFLGSMLIYSSRCLCDNMYKPTVYEIGKGIKKYTRAKRDEIEVEEVIYDGKGKIFDFQSYRHSIDNKAPVLISFNYDGGVFPSSGEWKRYRVSSVSVLGRGYWDKYISCRNLINRSSNVYYNIKESNKLIVSYVRRDKN